MAITLTIADETFQKTWDNTVLSSPQGMIFHTWQWLKLVEIQTSAKLLPFVLFKGTQLIALYPVFLQKRGLFTIAFSPPPRAYMLYLGPVFVDYESLKQDKKESIFIQIQDEVDRCIFEENKCIISRIRTSPGITDSRPLRWAGYLIEPLYTYRIPLSGGWKSVWEGLDRKLRVDINKAVREGVTVRSGDWDDLEYIHQSLYNRYLDQGHKPNDYTKYLRLLYDSFYPENLKIFIAEYKGERTGGIITLCYRDVMYHWVGVPKSSLVGIPVNDLVQWEAVKWAIDHEYKYYEIMDSGDVPRFRQFKAKWNPELFIWYSAIRYSSIFFAYGIEFLRKIQRKENLHPSP